MQTMSHHTLHTIAALPTQPPMNSKRRGYTMSSGLSGKHLNLMGILRIQMVSLLINLIITNICLILAVFCPSKALLISTGILGALASSLALFIISHCRKTHSTAEVCVLGMLIVYVTFFTVVAVIISVLSISMV